MAATPCIVPYPAETDFPIQNLPYGVFSTADNAAPRVGVAIGDRVLDLAAVAAKGLFTGPELADKAQEVFSAPVLNEFMALGKAAWSEARARITELLTPGEAALDEATQGEVLVAMDAATMHLPADIGDYIDFYSSRTHATNVGTLIRGAENALQPNWNQMPIGYSCKSSSIILSPAEVKRPWGQVFGPEGKTGRFVFQPEPAVDFELEMGCFIGGPENELGTPLTLAQAKDRLFGLVLFNDLSFRKTQTASYVPLGPSPAKSAASTMTPWVVTFEALAPFTIPGEVFDPPPQAYLNDPEHSTFNIDLEVGLCTAQSAEEMPISKSNLKYLTWSHAQQLTHTASNGCNVRPGDLLATGTISGPERSQNGCMLEISKLGRDPLELPNGETRTYLEDGDVVIMRGSCQGDGYRIGFGEIRDTILPAVPASAFGIEE